MSNESSNIGTSSKIASNLCHVSESVVNNNIPIFWPLTHQQMPIINSGISYRAYGQVASQTEGLILAAKITENENCPIIDYGRKMCSETNGGQQNCSAANMLQGNDEIDVGKNKIIWLNFIGNHIHHEFRTFYCRPLRRPMESFANRIGINFARVQFIFDGHCLHPDQTPEDYLLNEGDSIDVVEIQFGG